MLDIAFVLGTALLGGQHWISIDDASEALKISVEALRAIISIERLSDIVLVGDEKAANIRAESLLKFAQNYLSVALFQEHFALSGLPEDGNQFLIGVRRIQTSANEGDWLIEKSKVSTKWAKRIAANSLITARRKGKRGKAFASKI